jgi:hypothetical protein
VLGDNGRLLPGTKASAGTILRGGSLLGWARVGRQVRRSMAVEGPACLHVRRNDREHARHSRESSRLSAGLQPEAGIGFPIARIGVITSLACGTVLSLGFCRYAGKGQGEVSLLRRLWDVLRRGDVLLADKVHANLSATRGVFARSDVNRGESTGKLYAFWLYWHAGDACLLPRAALSNDGSCRNSKSDHSHRPKTENSYSVHSSILLKAMTKVDEHNEPSDSYLGVP